MFVHASSVTYGAVSFLGIITRDDIRCKFLLVKSILYMIKETSLTILQLQILKAVIAACVETKILQEIELVINQVFIWSGSTTATVFEPRTT